MKFVGPEFDVNAYWAHIRQHFPEVSPKAAEAGGVQKPTATSLYHQGLAAVSEEDQAVKAAKQSTSVDTYEALLNLMQEYRSSSGEESPDPPQDVEKSMLDATLGLGAGADTTIGEAIRMEHRERMSKSSSQVQTDKHETRARSTRKRTTTAEMEKQSLVDVKKPKKK